MNLKDGEIIASKYKVVKQIGKGGNGTVYNVVSISDNVTFALKTIDLNFKKYNDKNDSYYERKKYKRFCDEVMIVRKYQGIIDGILPILDINIPKKPNENNFPWYTMHIAEPMNEKVKSLNIEQKIESIFEIAKVLVNLHNKKIAHRDIKPENLYYYNDRWVLSDFGLVSYPNKQVLTAKKEAVGPKKSNTIAPEMREDTSTVNPLYADIYSLAKTLWIILTGKEIAFGGQYNNENRVVSLGSYIKGQYLVTLHEMLTECTSDIPEERPNAEKLVDKIQEWFFIKNDFKNRCKKEWLFIIKSISPYTPETVVWSNINEIVRVLNLVSQTESYNHMFLPSGGGEDLLGCELSQRQGFIELNEDNFIKLVKPKRLYMEIIKDYEWSYFLLETEQIQPCGLYEYDNEEEIYEEHVLEIEPSVYIEPFYVNYGCYGGNKLPERTREVYIGLKGNYVIFPKDSFYNLKMKSYNALQTKYATPQKFKTFIETIITRLKWIEDNPNKYKQILDRKVKQEEQNKKEMLKLYQYEEDLLKNFISGYTMNTNIYSKMDNSAEFEYVIDVQVIGMQRIYLSNDGLLKVKEDIWDIEELLDRTKWREDYYKFYNFEEAKSCSNDIKNFLHSCLVNLSTTGSEAECYIDMKRIKKPKHMFTKGEVIEALRNGNDKCYNRLMINKDEYVELIQPRLIGLTETMKYCIAGDEFAAMTNMVGDTAPIMEYIDNLYLQLLDAWRRHLISGERKHLPDWIDLSEEELMNRINEKLS